MICFEQLENFEWSISEIFSSKISSIFYDMRSLNLMWPYALRFVACKLSVYVFSLLYSQLLFAKLGLFVFEAESH